MANFGSIMSHDIIDSDLPLPHISTQWQQLGQQSGALDTSRNSEEPLRGQMANLPLMVATQSFPMFTSGSQVLTLGMQNLSDQASQLWAIILSIFQQTLLDIIARSYPLPRRDE